MAEEASNETSYKDLFHDLTNKTDVEVAKKANNEARKEAREKMQRAKSGESSGYYESYRGNKKATAGEQKSSENSDNITSYIDEYRNPSKEVDSDVVKKANEVRRAEAKEHMERGQGGYYYENVYRPKSEDTGETQGKGKKATDE